jgi:hypothetical protein
MGQQIDLISFSRLELENFVKQAMNQLEKFQEEFQKLQEALDISARVDPEVIIGWQEWIETLDTERNKWAQKATRLSEKNTGLQDENQRIFGKLKELIAHIQKINEIAEDNFNDKQRQSLALNQGFRQIYKITQAALSNDNDESQEQDPEINETN